MHSLDIRQMRGEPGYFGSYGFNSWAGLGEAKPIPTMHELGHSYWGAFPVIGQPDLDWRSHDGAAVSPALLAYHQDILAFMSQPPDEFEILRQRFRDLPGLSVHNTEPLFHSLEADVPYTTGGDLTLVPPILRKYWAYFLAEGPFYSWENAIGWFRALPSDKRTGAGKFLGFEHLNLDQYSSVPIYRPTGDLLSDALETVEEEERQRLTDLAEQFDLLIGDPQLEENFQFWRGYLRDKVALQRSHTQHLQSLSSEMADELAIAMSFLSSLEGSPESRAKKLSDQIATQPLLVNFLPAADDRTLVKFFASKPKLPDGPTLRATASFVSRLEEFGGLVEKVLAEGRKSAALGAKELGTFLDESGLDREQDLRLLFDLLQGTDREPAQEIVAELDKETIKALMKPVPTQLRAILQPDDLLGNLDISVTVPEDVLQAGITLLIENPSGNYRIDKPFIERLFEVMADRADIDPKGAARIVSLPRFPLEEFILRQPNTASAVLSQDINITIRMVRNSDQVLAPPARIIYRLIRADPLLAAKLVIALDQLGERELVLESLAYFAYDKARWEKFPALPISLQRNGAFLGHLVEERGAYWLEERLSVAVKLYRNKVEADEVGPRFLEQYRDTLDTVAALAPGQRETLTDVIRRAFE